MKGFLVPLLLAFLGAALLLYRVPPESPWSRESYNRWRQPPPRWLQIPVYTVLLGFVVYFSYSYFYLGMIVPQRTHANLREHRCLVSGRNAASGVSYKCQDGTTVWHKW